MAARSTLSILHVCFLFLFPSTAFGIQSGSFTSVLVSQQGLDFAKDVLVRKAIALMIPLHVPIIQKSIDIPFIGGVDIVFSNITLYSIDSLSSYVKPGPSGVTIVASGSTRNISMSWSYYYYAGFAPVKISDSGSASVQVKGLEVGLTLGLENQGGSLRLSFVDCGCYMKDISIDLDGGASWLYQWMIDAFKEKIGSAVESKITDKLHLGIAKLDALLRSLPKEIPVDDNAALNVTFIENPTVTNSSIDFDINGLFTSRVNRDKAANEFIHNSPATVLCTNQSKMLGITLDQAVFNSASTLYYDAKFMQWIVDKVPDQSLLNTAWWRFLIPQLYRKYPNEDMTLNFTLSSPPVVRISEKNIGAIVYADLVINVLQSGHIIPVACISVVAQGSGSVKVSGNNLGGSVWLDDFSMSIKSSDIGDLHLNLIEPIVRSLIRTIFLPYANIRLSRGFPLPIIHGFTLQNAMIICSPSKVTICSDVKYMESPNQHFTSPGPLMTEQSKGIIS